MKNIYIIGGTMGVGKTTACTVLKQKLERAVFLDGDWCWDADPFQVTDETKEMALDNICYLLNNFIRCSAYDNIIFCWVLHEQSLIDTLLSRLNTCHCIPKTISLLCRADALAERLQNDVAAGTRRPDIVTRSLERISLYDALDTLKIDVSDISPEEAADRMMRL